MLAAFLASGFAWAEKTAAECQNKRVVAESRRNEI